MSVRKRALIIGVVVSLLSTNAYCQTATTKVFICSNVLTNSCTDTPAAEAVVGIATNFGTGVKGQGEIGVVGVSESATGVGGSFQSGGDIIKGVNSKHQIVFRVGQDGNIFVRGELAGQNGRDGAQGVQGPEGPQGAQGLQGVPGIAGPTVKSFAVCGDNVPGTLAEAICSCNKKVAIQKGPCQVTAEAGSCSANSGGCCAVCTP